MQFVFFREERTEAHWKCAGGAPQRKGAKCAKCVRRYPQCYTMVLIVMMDDFKPQRHNTATPESAESTEDVAVMPEPAFSTPGQVFHSGGHAAEPAKVHGHPTTHHTPSKGKGPKAWWNKFKNLPRKQKILIGVIAALVLLAIGGAVYWFVIRDKPAPPAPVVQQEAAPEPPKPPEPIVSRLTGLPVTAEQKDMPNTAVMIENSPDARPQSGLYDAGVVFEMLAEGGISRFMALFNEAKPAYIGPVRSARPPFLDMVVPFDAPLAHAGGSPQALAQIKAEGIKDIDHGANPNAFQRVSNRYAPHNLYTSRDQLLAVQNAKGWNTSTFTSWTRKADAANPAPNAKSIDLTLSGFLYNVHYDYDATTNSYIRSEGGKPHIDERAAKPMNPKVVIAPIMPHHYEGIYSVYADSGSGPAYIFQDGTLTIRKWNNPNRQTQITFTDDKDAPLPLNAGQTWITLISATGDIAYKP